MKPSIASTGRPKYRTIVADPPWDYKGFASVWPAKYNRSEAKDQPYASLDVAAITSLPVSELADKNATLWIWTTNRYLPATFSIIEGWGFTYRQTLVWEKPNPAPWSGSAAPNGVEFILYASRGRAGLAGKFPSCVVRALKTTQQHSRKPDVFLDLIESISPAPRLEMFARRQRLGWDTWGDQALEHVEMAS